MHIHENGIDVLYTNCTSTTLAKQPRIVQDLRRIVGKMEASFKVLANLLTDMKMQGLDKKPDDAKLKQFLASILHAGLWV